MHPSFNSDTQRQIEEFERHVAQVASYHRADLRFQVIDRMQRDWDALHQPRAMRPPRLKRAGRWILHQVTAHLSAKKPTQVAQEESPIIDATFVEVRDEMDDTTHIKEKY